MTFDINILNIMDNEQCMNIIYYALLFVVMCLIVFSIFYMNKSQYGIENWHVISSILVVGGLLFALSGYSYYQQKRIESNALNKIRKSYYEYLDDHEDRILFITEGAVVSTLGTYATEIFMGNGFDAWKILFQNRQLVHQLLKAHLNDNYNESDPVSYDLLWYISTYRKAFQNKLSKKEISHILSLSDEKLLNILGSTYNGSRDRASIIFACISGRSIPMNEFAFKRYEEIKTYNPRLVHNLSFNLYGIAHGNTYSTHGPYMFLSSRNRSAFEEILLSINEDNYKDIIDRFGIGPIRDGMNTNNIIQFLQQELSLYRKVLNRPDSIGKPPSLIGKNREEIESIIEMYTNIELINAYEPRGRWRSRDQLYRLIIDDVLGEAKWSIHSVLYCTNDETMNIMTGGLHGEVNKTDITDPTLSYGVHNSYRCYQASELEACFREDNGVFMFAVPDWVEGANFPREFSIASIMQLKQLLLAESENYNVTDLIRKIDVGLNKMKSSNMRLISLKRQFEMFNSKQKHIVELYLVWMFTYSMWMRFWKGPGHAWPMQKVNVKNERSRNMSDRSSPHERDEHVFIQEAVRSELIEMYESDAYLKNWIENLPTIYYDFETQESSCASYNIITVLNKIAMGSYCMGFGSDTILKTSYYYITSLLDHYSDFDNYISTMMPTILDIEYTVVDSQLDSISDHTSNRYRVLMQRSKTLQQPMPIQPPFNPSQYENNVHIE